jgi:hypothetical protein
MIKKSSVYFVFLILIIVISGCQKNYESMLLGTWEGSSSYLGGGIRLTFEKNNKVICGMEELINIESNDDYQFGSDDEMFIETWDWIDYNGNFFILNNESLVIDANCLMGEVQWKIEEIQKDRLILNGEWWMGGELSVVLKKN